VSATRFRTGWPGQRRGFLRGSGLPCGAGGAEVRADDHRNKPRSSVSWLQIGGRCVAGEVAVELAGNPRPGSACGVFSPLKRPWRKGRPPSIFPKLADRKHGVHRRHVRERSAMWSGRKDSRVYPGARTFRRRKRSATYMVLGMKRYVHDPAIPGDQPRISARSPGARRASSPISDLRGSLHRE